VEILSNRDSTASLGGGRAARILVADDNSNIQRMVALALKDHGIDVLAVGNGEAALRSIAQLTPDLILADVFMPVRSGYEVCEFVKNDSRYSHIPVILLLGAFDPLDENEAKRVGADGVLKKPFVPPDPMIALVKALLEKSAPDRLAPVPVAVSAVSAVPEAPSAPEQPVFRTTRTAVEVLPPIEESPEIDYPPMGRDAFDSAAPIVASAGMASSVAAEIDDAESDVVTHQRDAALGEPAFWRPVESEQTPETDEPRAEEASRGRDPFAAAAEPNPGYFDAPGVPAEFSSTVTETDFRAQTQTVAEIENETAAVVESNNSDATAAAAETNAAAAQTVTDWAASPNDWVTPAAPASHSDLPAADPTEVSDGGSDWPPASQEPVVQLSGAGGSSFAPSSAVWNETEPASTAIESAVIESEAAAQWPEHESPVAAEIEQAAIEHAHDAAEVGESEVVEPAIAEEPAPELADTQRISPEVVASATHTQEESTATQYPVAKHVEAAAPVAASASAEQPAAARPTTDELVNAVVARVIAKLQPQIAEMINEEILRPVVSALVRKEIENQ
jgi:CheY-like chemotaxis protein